MRALVMVCLLASVIYGQESANTEPQEQPVAVTESNSADKKPMTAEEAREARIAELRAKIDKLKADLKAKQDECAEIEKKIAEEKVVIGELNAELRKLPPRMVFGHPKRKIVNEHYAKLTEYNNASRKLLSDCHGIEQYIKKTEERLDMVFGTMPRKQVSRKLP